MARKLAAEADPAELSELERLLEDHAEYQIAFELTHAYWKQHPDAPLEEREIAAAVDKIVRAGLPVAEDLVLHQWERVRRRARVRQRIMAIGVAVVLCAGTGLWVKMSQFRPKPASPPRVAGRENQVQTRMGTRSHLLLPDGTSVWLNAGSTLRYAASFDATNREVNLDGEAFFDVVKDPVRPFIVHTSAVNIRVLGTSFDVKAYAQDKVIETTLIRGSVEITRKDAPDAPRIMLKPNEKVIFHTLAPVDDGNTRHALGTSTVNQLEVTTLKPYKTSEGLVETAWVDSRLEFRGDTFDELAAKLERWYNIRITFAEEDLKRYRFTGSFEKETIVQALDDLRMTAKFNYKIDKNDIEILP